MLNKMLPPTQRVLRRLERHIHEAEESLERRGLKLLSAPPPSISVIVKTRQTIWKTGRRKNLQRGQDYICAASLCRDNPDSTYRHSVDFNPAASKYLITGRSILSLNHKILTNSTTSSHQSKLSRYVCCWRHLHLN